MVAEKVLSIANERHGLCTTNLGSCGQPRLHGEEQSCSKRDMHEWVEGRDLGMQI
jgi:hypothetical protein